MRIAILEDDARVAGLKMICGDEKRLSCSRNDHGGQAAGANILHQLPAAFGDL